MLFSFPKSLTKYDNSCIEIVVLCKLSCSNPRLYGIDWTLERVTDVIIIDNIVQLKVVCLCVL